MALPVLPVQGQNPWFVPRNAWDLAVKAELEGRLSETTLTESMKALIAQTGYLYVPEGVTPAQLTSLLSLAVTNKVPVRLPKEAEYTFSSPISVNLVIGDTLTLDMNGSTFNFINGAGMRVGLAYVNSAIPSYYSAVLSSGVIRGTTNFSVPSGSGIERGDLVVISSPVVITGQVRLEQTYTVGYVDGTTVYVDGIIAGDITPAQITSAGLTGDVTARFYKTANDVKIFNGVFRSSNKSSSDVLLNVTGVQNISLDSLTFKNPYRNGVNVSWSGLVRARNITSYDTGYVAGDQGYVSVPSSPDGLSFGYGILASRCYTVEIENMNAYRGWHGVDFAVGVTYGYVQDSMFHKNAYGVSSHEGAWVISVKDSHFFGGVGVTSRCFELIVSDNEFYTAKQGAISGHRTHHRLVVFNNRFTMGSIAGGAWLSFAGTYPDYVYSTRGSYNEVSGNIVSGVNAVSTLGVTGVINFLDNVVNSGDLDLSYLEILWPRGEKVAIIEGNKFRGTRGQFNLSITAPDTLRVKDNSRYGPAPTVSNGAMISISPSVVDAVIMDNYCENTNLMRLLGAGPYTLDVVANNVVKSGSVFVPPAGTTLVKNLIGNLYQSQSLTGVTVTQNVDNLTLAT